MRAAIPDRRPVAQPSCPHCDEPLRSTHVPSNHDRSAVTYRRCDDCGHEQDHAVERIEEIA